MFGSKHVVGVVLLVGLFVTLSYMPPARGRLVPRFSFEDVCAAADAVVIGEVVELREVGPVPEDHTQWTIHILAMEVRIKVLGAFAFEENGPVPKPGEVIRIEYESIDWDLTKGVANGPLFPQFEVGTVVALPLCRKGGTRGTQPIPNAMGSEISLREIHESYNKTDRTLRPGPRPTWSLLAEEGTGLVVPACRAAASLLPTDHLIGHIVAETLANGDVGECSRALRYARLYFSPGRPGIDAEWFRSHLSERVGDDRARWALLGMGAGLRGGTAVLMELVAGDGDALEAVDRGSRSSAEWAIWFFDHIQPRDERQRYLIPAIRALAPYRRYQGPAARVLTGALRDLPGAAELLQDLQERGGSAGL